MTGLLANLFNFSGKEKNNFLKIENSLRVEAGKNIYVLTAGRERFLVSVCSKGCQFLTKLEDSNIPVGCIKNTNCHSEGGFVRPKNLSNGGNSQIDRTFAPLLWEHLVPKEGSLLRMAEEVKNDNWGNIGSMDYIGLKKILK